MKYKDSNTIPLYKIGECLKYDLIAIYGCGKYGKVLSKHIINKKIVFIDKKAEKGLFFIDGIPVYSMTKYLEGTSDNKIILIGSLSYENDIVKTLNDNGLICGTDYLYVDFFYDNTLKRMVGFTKTQWKSNDLSERESEVLIPIIPTEELSYCSFQLLEYIYAGNYLSKNYKASISGFLPDDITETKEDIRVYKSIIDIYKAANLNKIIYQNLNSKQKIESEGLFEFVKDQITKLEDWNKISFLGFDFGVEIVRYYLRFGKLSFDPVNESFMETVKESIELAIFWRDYFADHKIKAVVLMDATFHEGIINHFADINGIPTYKINFDLSVKTEEHFNYGKSYPFLKDIFNNLEEEEKIKGAEWGKKQLEMLSNGDSKAVTPYRLNNESVYSYGTDQTIISRLAGDKRNKAIICPHIFCEDPLTYGRQISDDNYLEWLRILGEETRNSNFSWYIKLHPDENKRGNDFFMEFISTYPHITLLPARLNPIILKRFDFKYAFTVAGSIGHEYPYLGINVVNAGNNPHMSFDFCLNPTNKKELIDIIRKIDEVQYTPNIEELYQYYYLAYGRKGYDLWGLKSSKIFELEEWYNNFDEWKDLEYKDNSFYDDYMKVCTGKWHERMLDRVEKMFIAMDSWDWKKHNRNII